MATVSILSSTSKAAGRRTQILQALTLVGRIAFLYRIARFVLLGGYRNVRARGLVRSFTDIYASLRNVLLFVSLNNGSNDCQLVFRLLLSLPSSKAKIASELSKTREQIRSKLAPITYPDGVKLTSVRSLPEHGRDREWLQEEWRNLKKLERGDVDQGRVSGTVYHGGEELNSIIIEAMSNFLVSNPLHPDVFPGVRKMESEVVSMCLDLFNAPKGAGTTTSGGTESILLSVKTHRDWARKTKNITAPEMVIPSSAHAAFWKASQYFGVKLHVVPVDQVTRKADVYWMRRAINQNTIIIVGSAPNFPDGMIDSIPALGALAKRHNVGLHVDCCLGSFLMPFLDKAGLGVGVERFDFGVEGVTAISCDIHKYAFCPKGSSVIMYSSPELRRFQYYVMTDWAGGVYASPSMAGSRPGSVLAGAWAVMNHMGADGYTESCRSIVTATRSFADALRTSFPTDLYILGDPKVSIVAFGSHTLNIYAVGDGMSKRGWHLNALSGPPALHMAFTRLTATSVEKLLTDLADIIVQVRTDQKGDGDMVALYGLGQTNVGPQVVGKVAETYLDVCLE